MSSWITCTKTRKRSWINWQKWYGKIHSIIDFGKKDHTKFWNYTNGKKWLVNGHETLQRFGVIELFWERPQNYYKTIICGYNTKVFERNGEEFDIVDWHEGHWITRSESFVRAKYRSIIWRRVITFCDIDDVRYTSDYFVDVW